MTRRIESRTAITICPISEHLAELLGQTRIVSGVITLGLGNMVEQDSMDNFSRGVVNVQMAGMRKGRNRGHIHSFVEGLLRRDMGTLSSLHLGIGRTLELDTEQGLVS